MGKKRRKGRHPQAPPRRRTDREQNILMLEASRGMYNLNKDYDAYYIMSVLCERVLNKGLDSGKTYFTTHQEASRG